jgi:Domain of unknown function (DUF397)
MPLHTDTWFTPRRSNNGASCVETRFTTDAVHVRNSNDRSAGTATFTHAEWAAFIASVKDGDYDLT